ncbi:MAG: hydroxymethylbilane synthase [Myxococcota bacterium]
MKIRIATRKSTLARTQTRWVADRLADSFPGIEVEEVLVMTAGDKVTDRPLQELGGKALFVNEVEQVLIRGEADFAVHSMKDIPGDTPLAEGMKILCVPKREEPFDVLVTEEGSRFDSLPPGARVGTTSLRRSCQLKARRPDVSFSTLRGNVDTRLKKLHEGAYAAVVLAAAGLKRLGLYPSNSMWVIPPELCLPAVGQGALAIEGRADDEQLKALLDPLEDKKSRIETDAERAMLRELEGNCRVPIAGFARYDETASMLSLEGMVGSSDGTQILSAGSEVYLKGSDLRKEARSLGEEVARNLKARGASALIQKAYVAAAEQRQSNGGGNRDPFKWIGYK